ncbi:MAG: GTPase ObgE [Phycisphaerales bacterium]|nr:GTPase ObgE [Phycisphaerales bacterium]MCB9856404.1 GTPase ObgE [Phycisphaerales bacterium]MCB9864535.1 GTPase ObgE [Phycisphaerales bacterium]
MKFIDEAIICVRSGKGGDGCMSFRREKYVPKGGPDGGDGGDGGSVIIVADSNMATLVDFTGHHHWTAENGRPGEGANRSGKKGADQIVRVPAGTLVLDRDSGALLRDLTLDGDEVCVARGGRGGRGNTRFATATHQTPREFDVGEPGEERWLRLELKLIADVGVVGLPNAGKSTFLSRVSKAKPKIADYPFTTLVPNLGIVDLPGFRRYVVADVPGLVEGAHEGIGLGDQFLRHVERTRVIMHLIDLFPMEGSPSPEEAYRTIRRELEQYSPKLASKPEIVVANKLDLAGNDNPPELAALAEAIGVKVLGISAVSGRGVERIANVLWDMLEAAGERPDINDDLDD